jgi:hypothetical protein
MEMERRTAESTAKWPMKKEETPNEEPINCTKITDLET